MRIFEALAATLVEEGVAAAFTLTSEDTVRLTVELSRLGVPVYHTRHEAAAIGMAHGYARASGRVGVAIVGRGPAFTNALTLLVNAAKDRTGTGLLVIAGDCPPVDRAAAHPSSGQLKYIDQSGVLDVLGVVNASLRWADSACADLRVALARARAGGPVVVNVPQNVMGAQAGTAGARIALPAVVPAADPDPHDVAAVADLVCERWAVQRPVIVAGRGALLAEAKPELERLGDRLGALLGTTLLAKGLFRGHPFDAGVFGTVGKPVALALAPEADLVLAFGASLGPDTTWRGEGFGKARVVQFDTDPSAFGRFADADIAVVADARRAAAALADELERRGYQGSGFRTADLASRIAELRADDGIRAARIDGALDPRVAMTAIDRILPAERNLVIDSGHCVSFTGGYLTAPDAESFFYPHGFGSIGASLGFAFGVAVARPDRVTVYAGGDGSVMMTLNDLDTAVRYRLPIVFLVCNDGGFGAEVHMLETNGVPGESALYRNPPLDVVARALGADGLAVRSLDDVERLGRRLRTLSGPLVADCHVDPRVEAEWVKLFFAEPQGAAAR